MTADQARRYLDYLDRLRASGVTNMLGATPYLVNAFHIRIKEARLVLAAWMAIDRDAPAAKRVAWMRENGEVLRDQKGEQSSGLKEIS